MAVVKQDRLAVRLTAAQKRAVERAAEVSGRNVTEFSVAVLVERAEELLAERRAFDVDPAGWDAFLGQLSEPAKPVRELAALLRRPSVFEE